jgi:hypothetical protein
MDTDAISLDAERGLRASRLLFATVPTYDETTPFLHQSALDATYGTTCIIGALQVWTALAPWIVKISGHHLDSLRPG